MNPSPHTGRHPAWLLVLLALVAAQAWLTLGLFDPARDGHRLLNDDPVVSGRHPLHLYHGHLGACAFLDRGSLSCYDPAFHAGYPKTPVFDPGSRPAEMVLAFAGGHYSPASYKIALGIFCLLVPILVYLGARGANLSRGVALLATILGQAVFWSHPGRDALEAGDVDLLLAALFLLTQAGFLIRYHRRPGVFSLGGVVIAGLVAWFAHPVLTALTLPMFLLYYVTVGHRHRLAWHGPLFVGLLVAVAANAFWLQDLLTYWWIRVPPTRETPLLTQRTWQAWWDLSLWGTGLDKGLVVLLVVSGGLGLSVLLGTGQRLTARLFGLGAGGFLALALVGAYREPVARLGATQLVTPALFYLCVPAAAAVAWGLDRLRRWSGTVASPAALVVSAPVVLALSVPGAVPGWRQGVIPPRPLRIGLGDDQRELVEAIRSRTTPAARILWEDRRTRRGDSLWTALLPVLTDRAFVGGLDAESGIEHAAGGLIQSQLAGRPLAEWLDSELDDYCRKYNVGWVVCWSESARQRLQRWKPAGVAFALPSPPDQPAYLFTLSRQASYALTGSVSWRSADARGILLADAVPQAVPGESDGQIVLSLHYLAGMRVRPARVRIERAMDTQDNVPFVRLRLREPVGRILITWEGK